MSTIESLLSQLTQAVSTADLSLRHQISGQLQRLACSISTPRQIMLEHGYMYTEQVVAKVATDLNLFAILTHSEKPLTTEEIAQRCGGDPILIGRILRHLAATCTIAQVDASTFAANESTRVLASSPGEANILHGYDTLNEIFAEVPAFLKAKGYKNPDSGFDTPFHRVYDTKLQLFMYMQSKPEAIRIFHESIPAFESPVSWATVVPLVEKLRKIEGNAPLFVDVGGGHGYQCAAFRKATAGQVSGRVINEDLPETLAAAPKYDDVEMMAQNFYEKQQIQGAKIYYIRQCLHDLPDETAKQVLHQIKDAMSPQSILLIDEMVMPDMGASRTVVQVDITMMSAFGSMERTLPQWRKLLADVGLEIVQTYRYDPELEYNILEAELVKN